MKEFSPPPLPPRRVTADLSRGRSPLHVDLRIKEKKKKERTWAKRQHSGLAWGLLHDATILAATGHCTELPVHPLRPCPVLHGHPRSEGEGQGWGCQQGGFPKGKTCFTVPNRWFFPHNIPRVALQSEPPQVHHATRLPLGVSIVPWVHETLLHLSPQTPKVEIFLAG